MLPVVSSRIVSSLLTERTELSSIRMNNAPGPDIVIAKPLVEDMEVFVKIRIMKSVPVSISNALLVEVIDESFTLIEDDSDVAYMNFDDTMVQLIISSDESIIRNALSRGRVKFEWEKVVPGKSDMKFQKIFINNDISNEQIG